MKKQQYNTPESHTVIVMQDMRDGRKDYRIPLTRAKELVEQGKLFFELTNHKYCSIDGRKYA